MRCAWPGYYRSRGLTRIQFNSPKVTPLTNPAKVSDQRLCYCNSNAWGWHNSHQSSHQHNRLAYFPESKKAPKCTGGTITGPKTLPCCTPDTTSTSLLRHPSTITFYDRFDRNFVSIDNTEPPIPTEQSLQRMPWLFTLSKSALKSICTILAFCLLSSALCSVWDTHKSASQVLRPFDKQTGWLEAHHCIP